MENTKAAIENAKIKSEHITDDDIDTKYRIVQPAKKATHNLPVYKSLGSESKMEAFHPILANFGNTNCTPELADALVYSVTAQYNCFIQAIRISEY